MKESQDGQQPHLEPGAEGSARWLATEILLNMPDVDVKADIYAVGMVLWFILTEAYPFGTLPPSKIVQHVTCDGGRPPPRPRRGPRGGVPALRRQRYPREHSHHCHSWESPRGHPPPSVPP